MQAQTSTGGKPPLHNRLLFAAILGFLCLLSVLSRIWGRDSLLRQDPLKRILMTGGGTVSSGFKARHGPAFKEVVAFLSLWIFFYFLL